MDTAFGPDYVGVIEQHCICGSPDPLHSHTAGCVQQLLPHLKKAKEADLKRVSIEETIEARQNHYGHPFYHFSKTVGMLNAQGYCRRDSATGEIHELTPDDWPRIMITDKLARSHHDREYDENFHDIEGYSKCWRLVMMVEHMTEKLNLDGLTFADTVE